MKPRWWYGFTGEVVASEEVFAHEEVVVGEEVVQCCYVSSYLLGGAAVT